MKYIVLLLIIVGLFFLMNSCHKKITQSSVTGWQYNDADNDEFETTANKKRKKLPKEARKYFEGMKLIKSGTFIMGRTANRILDDNDTILLAKNNTARRVTVSQFYICEHEVTNAEYREYTDWIKKYFSLLLVAEKDNSFYIDKEQKITDWAKVNEIYKNENKALLDSAQKIVIKNFYPDTAVWQREFPYSYTQSYVSYYFTHPAYNDYPVVGVSWQQANDYCIWRTDRLNEKILEGYGILKTSPVKIGSFNTELYLVGYYNSIIDKYVKHKKQNYDDLLMPKFRLPSEAEWEYAALSMPYNEDKEIQEQRLFPWKGYSVTDQKGNHRANFGRIIDKSGFWIKSFSEDIPTKDKKNTDYRFTAPVKSFPPNNFDLYDMAGNVAEWVSDVAVARTVDDMNFNPFRGNVFKNKTDTVGKINYRKTGNINYIDADSTKNQNFYRNNGFFVTVNDDLKTAVDKVYKRMQRNNFYTGIDTSNVHDRKKVEQIAMFEIHNAKVLAAHPNPRVVKGGSWCNGVFYMLCSSAQVYSENKGSSRIGFRVAMIKVH